MPVPAITTPLLDTLECVVKPLPPQGSLVIDHVVEAGLTPVYQSVIANGLMVCPETMDVEFPDKSTTKWAVVEVSGLICIPAK